MIVPHSGVAVQPLQNIYGVEVNHDLRKRAGSKVIIPQKYVKSIGEIIYDNLYLLLMNEELKHLFTPGPMISIRSSREIISYLVRAKLYPVESIGYFNCKRPCCEICAYVNETDSFTSTVTGETHEVNHRFDCLEKCLIYILTCNKCRKKYVRQTIDTFPYR